MGIVCNCLRGGKLIMWSFSLYQTVKDRIIDNIHGSHAFSYPTHTKHAIIMLVSDE